MSELDQFKLYLQENALKIDQEIEKNLTDFSKKTNQISLKLGPLINLLIDSCQGGKKIRGTLVKLGWEIGGGKSNPEIFKVAAAFEILHASILIHDDVIDQSPTRRGKATLYMALGGDHYGISQAIGLADVGLFLAVKIIAETNFAADRKIKAIAFFTQTVVNTGLGEVLDVQLPHLDGKRKEDDVITIHQLKTAQYTISGPLILGAILAGAKLDQLNKLDQFGESLGIAFQIQDDILGVFGDEKEIGKSVKSDVEEGKNTLLITQALKKANLKQKKILDNFYGKTGLTKKDFNKIKQVFVSTGALKYSQDQAFRYIIKAKKILPKLTKDRKLSIILDQMADYSVKRSK